MDDEANSTYGGILDWLYENVGEETADYGIAQPVVREGHGWQIITHKRISEYFEASRRKPMNVISWHLQIEDDHLATLFALRWIK